MKKIDQQQQWRGEQPSNKQALLMQKANEKINKLATGNGGGKPTMA
jgi:hypothetical protein